MLVKSIMLSLVPALCCAGIQDAYFVGPGGGGWIECVCPSRHVKERLLVGCDVGGFYYSDDYGRSYEIRNVGLGDPMVATIAEDPVNPETLIVGGNGGLYRSFDCGKNWHRLTNGLPGPSSIGHANPIKRVVWDETRPERIYAATGCPRSDAVNGKRGYVYRSDDAGDTWRMVVSAEDPLIAENPTEIRDLAISAMDGDDLLALTSRGLFRSLDGAEHWTRIGMGLPENAHVRMLARSPRNPCRVYATVRDLKSAPKPYSAAVWRSDDNGLTWQPTASLPQTIARCEGRSIMDFWGRMCVVVDPLDENVVWCGGLWYRPGLCYSRDGGRTWTQSLSDVPAGWVDSYCWQSPCSMGVSRMDGRTIAFGTSAGVFVTEDKGRMWNQRYTLRDSRSHTNIVGTGLNTLCVSDIKPDRFIKNRTRVGFYDVGLMETTDGGRSWTRLMDGISDDYSGTCFTIAQSPTESNKLWAVFGSWGGETRGIPASSENGGKTWRMHSGCRGWQDSRADSLCVLSGHAPYELAVKHQKTGLMLSRDGGLSWTPVDTAEMPDGRRVTALVSVAGVLYAGTRAGRQSTPRVWRSFDQGRSWVLFFERSGEADGEVSAIAVCGSQVAVVVKCCGSKGGCWLTSDDGESWRKVYSEQPWNDLNGVAFGADGSLAIASRNARWHDDIGGGGLVVSFDGGRLWRQVSQQKLGRPEVMTLVTDPHDKTRLWAGTWGNSVIVVNLVKSKERNE